MTALGVRVMDFFYGYHIGQHTLDALTYRHVSDTLRACRTRDGREVTVVEDIEHQNALTDN